ncbi:MAG: AAA family ATPase, partial [Caulobacteraceae bacterium]
MHFTGLRLSGFKSFVDPAELRIEPGLTGIVGPNGCGKSNMLEALRWVMGAGSAKAMRGEGMDDVIFGGAGARPARNLAEVTLTIDNAVGDAPPAFADQPVIEVTRRIDRGAGSTYRINGVEARARDVQLLFADASTGANSPALVRQGQIAELIAARPENRRRVLEEAAGVSGLHGRRHEAELKVSAAETNLARLDDVRQEMEGQLARFRREARQATRYRALAAEIRTLREAVARARWREARVAAAASETELDIARRSAEETARGAASAAAEAAATEAALPALRDEAAVAASVLHRLDIARARLERAMEAATAEVARLATERSRLAGDQARESQIGDDAAAAIARLDDELGGLARAASEAPERLPLMRAAAAAADAERDEAQAAVEALASRVAAMEAASATLALRADECAARLARNQRALDQARAERAAAPAPDVRADAAEAQLRAAEGALLAARAAVEAREQRRDEAAADEIEARQAMRATDDRLSTLESEARGLAKLVEAASPSG